MRAEGRSLGSRRTLKVGKEGRLGNLVTPGRVQRLQQALHAKAKEAPGYRFYSLYDKLYREDVLRYAYDCCRANGGAAGVDGETFEKVEAYGVDGWLGELAQEMKERSYKPEAVKRVYILKSNGKQRPLGIPSIKDRVIQMAAVVVLGPIFEADLEPEQYAYRAGRNALDAIREVHGLLNRGHQEVVDADLADYFGSLPHPELMKSIARRVVDKHVLHLIKSWLEASVEETDKRGRRKRTTQAKDQRRGSPQGSPVSPLLSNVYMRRFIRGWKRLGFGKRFGAKIVNYADDQVICCKRGQAGEALKAMRDLVEKLKLTINEEKTRISRIPEERFDFLGYTFGRCYSPKTGKAYIGTRPSKKSMKSLIESLREQTSNKQGWKDAARQVEEINRKLTGWANYFKLGQVSKAYRAIDAYTNVRLRRWFYRKHKEKTGIYKRYPSQYFYEDLGLVRLSAMTKDFPWAKA
jgi:group II intron reverse transcriptase/maturase